MYQSLFQSSTIPVLEQVVNFAQARHTVLAGNIANLDTPGYRVRDLSVEDFQSRLVDAIQSSRQPQTAVSPGLRPMSLSDRPISPGDWAMSPGIQAMRFDNRTVSSGESMAKVSKNPKTILYHDDSNVGMEHQVTEMAKNQMQHNLALSIMTAQFRLLQTAISERV